jgi:peptidoglycan/LPS O-acetylase OafA/YrhL
MIVVLSHLGALPAFTGNYAVICFFVLSGFLITYLLLVEYDRTGHIALRRFYLRRALRIFPAFYGYAACFVTARLITRLPVDWPSVFSCLIYVSNYFFAFSGRPFATMIPTWSLAVEEQFYLIWPFLLRRLSHNRTTTMKVLAGAILAVWIYRFVATSLGWSGMYVYLSFETRADALAIGCLVAVANRQNRLPRWLIDGKWQGLIALLVLCACFVLPLDGPRYGWALAALGFAVLMIQSIAHARTRWYRFLSSPPLYALGIISYSLYLYHPFASHLPGARYLLPLGVAYAIALATASYWIVERPFLSLKGRMSKG